MNQFFYIRKIPIPAKATDAAGAPAQYKEVKESFNVNLVTRSGYNQFGQFVVLLNDMHEGVQQVPVTNKKGTITGYRNEKVTLQSEIPLNEEDIARFIETTQVKI